jgi:hypothetical protein
LFDAASVSISIALNTLQGGEILILKGKTYRAEWGKKSGKQT